MCSEVYSHVYGDGLATIRCTRSLDRAGVRSFVSVCGIIRRCSDADNHRRRLLQVTANSRLPTAHYYTVLKYYTPTLALQMCPTTVQMVRTRRSVVCRLLLSYSESNLSLELTLRSQNVSTMQSTLPTTEDVILPPSVSSVGWFVCLSAGLYK